MTEKIPLSACKVVIHRAFGPDIARNITFNGIYLGYVYPPEDPGDIWEFSPFDDDDDDDDDLPNPFREHLTTIKARTLSEIRAELEQLIHDCWSIRPATSG